MSARYRVQLARPGLEHAPGLVGDFETVKRARQEARVLKDERPETQVTVTPGTDTDGFTATGDPEAI